MTVYAFRAGDRLFGASVAAKRALRTGQDPDSLLVVDSKTHQVRPANDWEIRQVKLALRSFREDDNEAH